MREGGDANLVVDTGFHHLILKLLFLVYNEIRTS